MDSDQYSAQIIGVFFAETAKNIAKGSANLVYENFNLFFDSEITALGLNDPTNAEEVSKQLEARPEILEKVQRKLTAHPTLAEEIIKAIKEQTGQNLTAINITSHNQSGGQTAQTIINNNALPTPPVTKVKVDVEYRLEQAVDEQETYRLVVSLVNVGDNPISNYRLDVEFPRKYLNDSTFVSSEIEDKITEKCRFFRITSDNQNNSLYPDDKRVIFSPNYYVRGIIPYDDILKIKVYLNDQLTRTIEKPMQELAKL